MNFFKFLNFPLKSTKITVGLRFQLVSVTINFTDNRDYRAVLYSMAGLALLVVSTDSGRAAAGVVNCSGMRLWWGPHYHFGLSSHFWGKSKKTKAVFG